MHNVPCWAKLIFWWCMGRSFVSKKTSTERSWGAPKSALQSPLLTPHCIPRPPSPRVPPFVQPYPNKLATQVGEGRRRERGGADGPCGGGVGFQSVRCTHGALKRLSRHTHTHTPCLSDWMLREKERRETFKIGERPFRALRGHRRLLSSADSKETVELSQLIPTRSPDKGTDPSPEE